LRPIVCNLFQNVGSPAAGNQAVLSSKVVKLGTHDLAVDDQLTKIQPGEMTVEVMDPDDSVWAFLQSQLAISGGLLPPFLQIQVGGVQRFLGIVDPSRIVRHLAVDAHSIELGAQDWSVMLSNQYLDLWSRPAPRVAANRPATASLAGYSALIGDLINGFNPNEVIFAGEPNWISAGDRLTCDADAGEVFTALRVQSPPAAGVVYDPPGNPRPWPAGTLTQVTLDRAPWVLGKASGPGILIPDLGTQYRCHTAGFVRLSSTSADAEYYTVLKAVPADPDPKVYEIYLDTVDGISAGDTLHCILGTGSASWTVLSVDPELRRIATKDEVTRLDVGNRIFFDADTAAELVLQDAAAVLTQAVLPFGLDLSRFIKAPLPMPVFGWLPLQSSAGASDLLAVSDLGPSLAPGGIQVASGLSAAYTGGPDAGWSALGAFSAPAADWTGQRATAPASLMPYEVPAASPQARRRNRTYHDFNWLSVDNGPTPTAGAPSTWTNPWTSAMASQVPAQLFYDYLLMRKIAVAAGGGSLTATPWTGSAWGAASALAWPTGHFLQSVSNFPGGPAGSLLAVTSADTLELALFSGSASCALPLWLKGAVLVPTPGGPYLIGSQAYGRVVYSGGVLSIAGAVFTDQVTCFWPNTFVARTATEGVILGRVDLPDASGSIVTETWLFRLTLPPDTSSPLASVVFSEKIADGVPVFAGAMLDPLKAGRVVGHYGGRLFQVDTVMPWTIERFTPSGMTSLECLEHVCQLNNAMAVPTAAGVMAIVSRSLPEAAVPLTVALVKNDQSLSWPNFYSIVRTTTQDGGLYYDAEGEDGGALLEINNQPMLWTLSQAGAMAEAYCSWFGTPRAQEAHTWTFPDADAAPPWESLPPFARVTVNGTGPWRLMGLTQDYIEGTAQAVLVED